MADFMSPTQRSQAMSKVRGRNTKPEKLIRSHLHKKGFRFRINNSNIPGKPDIVLKKHNAVIFVHGCFWHHHEGCKKSKIPETRKEFWNNKIGNTVKRDKKNIQKLKELGWRIAVVWECATKNAKTLSFTYQELSAWLRGNEQTLEIK